MIESITRMPAWARWALYAALGVLLLTIVQTISDTERLTQVATAREMLRFAVPIFLAILPVISPGPMTVELFNQVFVCVIASLVLQGWTIPLAGRLLGVQADAKP